MELRVKAVGCREVSGSGKFSMPLMIVVVVCRDDREVDFKTGFDVLQTTRRRW